MATTRIESQFTNATALTTAVQLLSEPETILDVIKPEDLRDLVTKLNHMATVASKPSAKKATGPTKSQLINIGLARKVAEFIWALPEDELATSKLVMTTAGIAEIASTQKATSLLGIAADNGWVARREVKSRVYWGRGDINPIA